jgi:hypothetical protein
MLTVFREQVVSPPNDEPGHEIAQLLQLLLALGLLAVGRVRVAPTDDRVLKVPTKIVLRAQEVGIREAQEREVLGQIVLHVYQLHLIKITACARTCIGVPVRMTRR